MDVFKVSRRSGRPALVLVVMSMGVWLPAVPAAAGPTEAASGPHLQFNSVLSSYRPFEEQAVQNWRDSNDKVGKPAGRHGDAPVLPQNAPTLPPQRLPRSAGEALPATGPDAARAADKPAASGGGHLHHQHRSTP